MKVAEQNFSRFMKCKNSYTTTKTSTVSKFLLVHKVLGFGEKDANDRPRTSAEPFKSPSDLRKMAKLKKWNAEMIT